MEANTNSKSRLGFVYLSGFLMAVHFASISYVNSSLLGQFVGDNFLSVLYVIGSLLAVISLFLAPFLLRKYGSVPVFLFFVALEILAVFGLGSFSVASLVLFFFVVHLSADSILYFCLDVNLEQEIKREGTTGRKRGVLLAISNIAWVLSPLTLVFLVSHNSFSSAYVLSGLALMPLLLIIALLFRNTKKADLAESNIATTIKNLWHGGDTARIIGIQFLLNFFFAWMVIYLPLLLNKEIGFSWSQIGFLFMIMLSPFLLFEWPIGILSDKKFGEKEFIIAGIVIISGATFLIPMISAPIFWTWAGVLFFTRVGAALTEISAESFFFKHVKEEDTGRISVFRAVRPLAFIVAPIVSVPIIYFFSYAVLFYFLAGIMLLGLFFVPKIDTK